MKVIARKIAILGDHGVGKTSLVARYVRNTFYEHYKPTLGADLTIKDEKLANGQRIQLYLLDIAGNPAFTSLRHYYLHGAHGVIICFDLDDPVDSLANAVHLKEIFRAKTENVPVILVGTKGDLVQHGSRNKTAEMIEYNGYSCTLTSAKTGENVRALFLELAINLTELTDLN